MDGSTSSVAGHKEQTTTYVAVFLILAVLTAVEIGISYLGLDPSVRNPVFLASSLAKAGLVAAFYMHLREDSRVYTGVFLAPVLLVLVVAILMVVS
jgi:caa(3)-type oxidase subunit IV